MAIRAGQILHLGGDSTVIDRLQSAGLGDINIGTDIIREVGNPNNVDKVLQDPDFSFSMESFDVSIEAEALLAGYADGGASLVAGDMIAFSDMKCLHVASPWKTEVSGSAGVVDSGVLIPSYYVTRASYRFGVNDNAGETFELAGSQYYMAQANPVTYWDDGGGSALVLPTQAVRHRVGGKDSTEYKYVFGVIVNGDVQIENADYIVTTPGTTEDEVATVEFQTGSVPTAGDDVFVAYFDRTTPGFPTDTSTHPSTTTKPAAVRGRDIRINLHVPSGGSEASGSVTINGVQSVTLEGTRTSEQEREMGTSLPISRTVTAQDVTGDVMLHPATSEHLFLQLRRVTGVASAEVISVLNDFPVGLEIQILNPKNRTQVLKTLWVPDAKFQIPGVPARAGAVTDFTMRYESSRGDFYAYLGEVDDGDLFQP